MARRLKGRHQAEQDAGSEGDRGGERQNVPIDLGPSDRGQIGRQHGRERVEAPGADEEPEYAAAHRKQQTLGEQLSNHSRTACTEGQSNGDLPPAAGPARKQQVRDVGAGDEEHEADRGQQHQQRRADVADDLLVERDYCERHALIGIWMCLLQPAGERARSDARAFEIEAGPESRDRAQDDHAARWRRAVQPSGPPDLRIRDDRRPEGVRHDADNLVGLAAERHLTSESPRVSAEAPYPESVRDDRNPRRTRTVVLEREIAPARGRDAQNGEVLEGDLLPDERFWIAKSRDRRLPASDGGHTFERSVLAGQIHEVPGGGEFARGAAAGRHVLPDHRDSVRIPVWQGPEQQGIHHAEDGRVGADPEREGHGHHSREPGSSGDHSERILQVLQKPVHPKSSCFVRIGRSTPSEPHAVPWVAESVIMYGGF